MNEKDTQMKEYEEFMHYLLAGNRIQSSVFAHDYLVKNHTINELYENIIRKSLYEIGVLWEHNKISVATEHLASKISESILNELYFKIIANEKNKKKAIVACVENELHQIGIKMISDVFEMNGWNTFFLGANTPTFELIEFSKVIQPDILAVSLSLYFNIPTFERKLYEFNKEFPQLPILVGGQAFSIGGKNILQKYPNVTYQEDTYSTDLFLKNIKI